jgi:hypothetical protein
MIDPSDETWLPVVGYEGLYEVSDQGRVRSLDRYVANNRWPGAPDRLLRGRILKPIPGGGKTKKYFVVSLGQNNNRKIDHIVLEAFVGPRPLGLESCHFDDNGHNNRLANLRWDTRSENHRDSVRNGTWVGNGNGNKKQCINGHEFSKKNTWINPKKGNRQCRTCLRRSARESYRRKYVYGN